MNGFKSLGLSDNLVKAVTDLGFDSPTPIQEKAIPILLSGVTDFVGLAQTGTGKTAAFGLPLLQLIVPENNYPQALIVCPTRELCLQICNDLMTFKKFSGNISTEPIYGGASIIMQIKALKKGVQIVVATPGRLIDMIERKVIDLQKVKYVVLDEADEMLNMGFRDDIDFVLKNTINRESTWLFSATMPSEVRAISKRYMVNPQEVTVGKKNTANVNIDHQYFVTNAQQRFATLKRLIDFNPGIYGIIFTRTKKDAQEITERMVKERYDIEALHGDLTQQQRDKVMQRFRQKSIQLLIATDVAARGIDVEGITHVINYELPDDLEVYTHRSGRTARAGKSGICITICHTRELFKIRQLEKMANATFHKLDIPSGKDVCRKQFFHFMDRLIAADVSHGDYETYMPDLEEKFEEFSKEDVLKRIAALEFNDFLKYYQNADDLNARQEYRGSRQDGHMPRSRQGDKNNFYANDNGFARLFINLGTKDGFYKASFLQFILDESDLKKDTLGRIDMREMNSWVEVDKSVASKMIKSLDGKSFQGRRIRMNEADSVAGKSQGKEKRKRTPMRNL
jgi:ATP-dependent RNA helicase DeaD